MYTNRFVPVRHQGRITVLDSRTNKLIEPEYIAPDWGYAEAMASTLNQVAELRASS